MKYAILVGDGMADRPLEALGGRTPLQAAHTPWMDAIAREGILGLVRTIPSGFAPGSDIANLVLLGYDPTTAYTGRGPLEAASMGVSLGTQDVAFRCNLVHLTLEEARPRMKDFTAGHIRTETARPILDGLAKLMGDDAVDFHAGVSYRHLMVWRNGPGGTRTTPPHDITGQEIEAYLPQGEGAERLVGLMKRSQELFREQPLLSLIPPDHPDPPNSIWPWGQGRAPNIEPLTRQWALDGAIITAVDLLKGLGTYAGLRVVEVPGATGYFDTDYGAKARYALEAMESGCDFIFVHVEAPDEAGHQGDVEEKIRAIESFDREVVGRIMEGIRRWQDWTLMVLPDHATPIAVKTHTEEPVPFAVLSASGPCRGGGGFNEVEAERCGFYLEDGRTLLHRFLNGQWD